MKALITGCSGFIGSHLADLLVEKKFDVYGTTHYGMNDNIKHLKDKITIVKCNITDKSQVKNLISKIKPDYIFHMAAQSNVMQSWNDAEGTMKTNILGTLYLFDAIREAKINPIIVVACSSAEYGVSYKYELPTKENKEFRPTSPYAVSKIGEDMLSYLYWRSLGMKIIRVRFFNITGPRKTSDACSDFSRMIAYAEKKNKNVIEVGYLDSIRDITDVRDAVKATLLAAKKGKYGEVYNICSGKGYKIENILKKMLKISTRKIKVKKVEDKMRPYEEPIFIGDNSKMRKLGWSPEIPIDKTLSDMLEYWRGRI